MQPTTAQLADLLPTTWVRPTARTISLPGAKFSPSRGMFQASRLAAPRLLPRPPVPPVKVIGPEVVRPVSFLAPRVITRADQLGSLALILIVCLLALAACGFRP